MTETLNKGSTLSRDTLTPSTPKKKGANCGLTTAKILLIVFDGIFLACGLVILGVGIWVKSDVEFANLGESIKLGLNEPIVEIVTWTFIGIGIFVFAIAFAGIIGVIRESKVILGFYIICVFIVFAAEASAGIYAGVRKDHLLDEIKNKAAAGLKVIYVDTSTGDKTEEKVIISQGFNYVQQQFKCCGINNFMDYKNSTFLASLGNKIRPNATMSWACCQPQNDLKAALTSNGMLHLTPEIRDMCMLESIEATSNYGAGSRQEKEKTLSQTCSSLTTFRCQGCVSRLEEWAQAHMIILLGIGVGIGCLQLLIMILAVFLCLSISKPDEKKPA